MRGSSVACGTVWPATRGRAKRWRGEGRRSGALAWLARGIQSADRSESAMASSPPLLLRAKESPPSASKDVVPRGSTFAVREFDPVWYRLSFDAETLARPFSLPPFCPFRSLPDCNPPLGPTHTRCIPRHTSTPPICHSTSTRRVGVSVVQHWEWRVGRSSAAVLRAIDRRASHVAPHSTLPPHPASQLRANVTPRHSTIALVMAARDIGRVAAARAEAIADARRESEMQRRSLFTPSQLNSPTSNNPAAQHAKRTLVQRFSLTRSRPLALLALLGMCVLVASLLLPQPAAAYPCGWSAPPYATSGTGCFGSSWTWCNVSDAKTGGKNASGGVE